MPNRILHAILLGIAALALVVPALVVRYAPHVVPHRQLAVRLPPRRVVPPAELPPVEPTALEDLTPEDARAFNADVPFSIAPNPAARPFRLGEDAGDVARATDCLAAAVFYEAGDDPPGERAVAQVVLNRVRHPAFPKTVCGVVFQGSERKTGCQFTFTCDGSLARRKPSDALWAEARVLAAAALKGAVYRPVGYATHYHTDYVVPYWQASLDKIVAVHTQLFYRWSGWWGTPPAFDRRATPGEPVMAALAPLSEAHRVVDPAVPALLPAGEVAASGFISSASATAAAAAAAPATFEPKPVAGDANSFLVTIPAGMAPDLYPALAAKACGERAICKFGGWTDARKVPTALPVLASDLATMTFSFLRDRNFGYQRTLWNCQQVKRPDPAQCMKTQAFQPAATPSPAAAGTPSELTGTRRKGDAKPVTAPAP